MDPYYRGATSCVSRCCVSDIRINIWYIWGRIPAGGERNASDSNTNLEV